MNHDKIDNAPLKSMLLCAIIITAAKYAGLFVMPENRRLLHETPPGTGKCAKTILLKKKEGHYYGK